jgi:hypothetical protein
LETNRSGALYAKNWSIFSKINQRDRNKKVRRRRRRRRREEEGRMKGPLLAEPT